MGRPFQPHPAGPLPDPAAFPLGSLESRATARQLLEARRPVEYVVYLDDNGEPIHEPGKNYSPFVLEAPRELTREEWIASITGPDDPVEREQWLREKAEKLQRQRERWLKREKELEERRRTGGDFGIRLSFEAQSPPGETREEWKERMRLAESRLAEFEERDG